MCGRFVQMASNEGLAESFALDQAGPELGPRYNIAPGAQILAVRADTAGHRHLVQLRWGLIPAWAKDRKIAYSTINARAETIATKPAFRAAFRQRRCLIPADGFYEWKATASGKQPYYLILKDREPFALAGLWEEWTDPETGEIIQTATIVVTSANALVAEIHDRMPVILRPDDYATWLDPGVKTPSALEPLLRPYPAELMTTVAVDRRVNSARQDDAGLIEPLLIT